MTVRKQADANHFSLRQTRNVHAAHLLNIKKEKRHVLHDKTPSFFSEKEGDFAFIQCSKFLLDSFRNESLFSNNQGHES